LNHRSTLSSLRLRALVGVFGISFSAIFVRLADVSPSTAAFYRAAYALPVLALLWLAARRGDRRSAGARLGAVLAGAILGFDLWAWHHSIEFVGAGLATVLGNTQVFFVALAAWWLHDERPRRAVLLASPLVFLGVVATSGLGRSEAYGTDPVRGVLYGMLTALLYTGFLLVFRRAHRDGGPVLGPWLDATIGTLAAIWAIGALRGEIDYGFSWPTHGWLIALALVSQVFGWLLITHSLPRMPAVETSVLLLAQPVLTVLWGLLLLGESLSLVQIAGVVLVVSGLAYLSLGGRALSSG
jgi:drug/metabolite transporter (DMT)-like permease